MHVEEVQALDDIQGNAAAHPIPLQLARPLPQPLQCMLQISPLQQHKHISRRSNYINAAERQRSSLIWEVPKLMVFSPAALE